MRIPYLKWITYAIMPLVYDQSLSYVELLNKVVAKLNEVIEQTNNLSSHIDNVLAEWLETPEAQAAVQNSIGKYKMEVATFKLFVVLQREAARSRAGLAGLQ